jgi:hypothetical protein
MRRAFHNERSPHPRARRRCAQLISQESARPRGYTLIGVVESEGVASAAPEGASVPSSDFAGEIKPFGNERIRFVNEIARFALPLRGGRDLGGGKKVHRGRGPAAILLALETALRALRVIGGRGVVAPPPDDKAPRFCARWGFQDLPDDPRRGMMAPMPEVARSVAK